ncbi:MAG: RecX family transcriptional regulator [Paludibacteraceae bacterium]|nr:RecX family transcriptional regulator [Paludibacteraceae bacterium]
MWKRANSDGGALTTVQLLQKAETYCSKAEHCRLEVRDKLFAWGADNEKAEEIIDRLIDEGFISEERYCRAYLHDKVLFQGWGKEKVRMMLSAKRLPSALINEALLTFPEQDYMAVLQRVAQQKQRTLSGEEDERVRDGKLTQYLLTRGFTYSEIKSSGVL